MLEGKNRGQIEGISEEGDRSNSREMKYLEGKVTKSTDKDTDDRAEDKYEELKLQIRRDSVKQGRKLKRWRGELRKFAENRSPKGKVHGKGNIDIINNLM